MRRYASEAEIQKAVNLKATGLNNCEIAREIGRPHQTVGGWFFRGGLVERLGLTPNVEIVKEEVPPAKIKVRVPAGSSSGDKTIKVLGIGDAHDSPNIPKDRFLWMGRLANERGVDYIVDIGDFSTFDSLNAHIPNETLAGKSKNPFALDIQSRRDARGMIDHGLQGHKPRKRQTRGNHERRVYTYEDFRPEVAGMLVGELNQADADFGWEWTDYGEFSFIGQVGFIHCPINRLNKGFGGENSPIQIANKAVFDVVYGHEHLMRMHRSAKIGPSKHVTVLNLGCALPEGHVESYMLHGATTGWWFGVCVITIQNGQIVGNEAIPMADLERKFK